MKGTGVTALSLARDSDVRVGYRTQRHFPFRAPRDVTVLNVAALLDDDVVEAAALHRRVLDMEFLTRFGPRFMQVYYRAWWQSPGAITLVARDEDDVVVGVLLGATDPARHVRGMVKGHAPSLALAIVARALTHPRLALDLMVTRGWRYTRALVRLVAVRWRPRTVAVTPVSPSTIGEVTHVLVRPEAQGRGVGRALLDAAVAAAREAGDSELTLVTPPDMEARHFYERLGWLADGEMRSRSGEEFLRYRLPLT